MGCQPTVAMAGPSGEAECTSPDGALVNLDGSGSSDPDSSPGTNDDIVSSEWFRDLGEPDQTLLGTGMSIQATLPFGLSSVGLRVTDAEGNVASSNRSINVVDTTPPSLSCPAAQVEECVSPSGAPVSLTSEATDLCSSSVLVRNDRSPGGADASGIYPLGSTRVGFTATDVSGNTASCASTVTVQDTTPPQIAATTTPSILWPPNHRMVDVGANVVVTDACSTPSIVLASVTSSEADDSAGSADGNTSHDVQGADIGAADFDFQLRAERDGTGEGRTYRATYIATDGSGNMASSSSLVFVPHDQGGASEPLLLSALEGPAGTLLSWDQVPGALSYRVIRGSIASLREAGAIIDLGAVSCIAGNPAQPDDSGREDADVPPLGEAFFYLVAYNDGRDSGYGSDTASKPRVKTSGGCD